MKRQSPTTRRSFLRRTAAIACAVAAGPTVVSAAAIGGAGQVAPSNRITIGMIGVGDHGKQRNLQSGFLNHADAQIVAVCDVDKQHIAEAMQMIEARYAKDGRGGSGGIQTTQDFREVVAREDVDAVMVSTPDHWHVPISLMAMRAGKDVCCEKPLTLTIDEGKAMTEVARRYGRITQTSSENRSMAVFHRICELVRNGRVGKLQRIEVGLPSGRGRRPASRQVEPPPPTLDWNMWLGPAPEAPYCAARVHWNFRWIYDYSGGMLTDWGAHIIDVAQWGHDSEHGGPVEVEGVGEYEPDDLYNTATTWDVRCRYADGVELRITSSHPSIRFEGTDGWVESPGWGAALQASSRKILGSPIGPGDVRLFTCPEGEHRDFLNCVKSRRPCYAPFEVGHRTITIAHLGNISMWLGRKVKWDPVAQRVIGDDTANRLMSRAMREPWCL